MPNPEKKNWIVHVRATIYKDVYCDDCTEEEARTDPFEHASDEVEVEQVDWEVKRVEENK